MSGNAPGIMFRNVGKSFAGTVEVLDDLSLDITADRFVAVLGPTGCGKTTMLRMAGALKLLIPAKLNFQLLHLKLVFAFRSQDSFPGEM